VAARISGTAPLAVHFDSTGTTTSTAGVDTFHQITYAYDFGDERGLKWAVSGQPKNTQAGGPVAAHVFDVAGTYNVSVRATDASGNYSTATVTITVQDPNTVYAGAKTVCISMTTDFTGCPTDAAQQRTMPSGTQWNGKRWLLHAGQDFSSLGKISIQDGNAAVQVASFGSGAKPVVQSVGVGDWRPSTSAFANDVTIMNLASNGGMGQNVGKRVLFYKNDLTGNGFTFGDVSGWGLYDQTYRLVATSAFYNPSELFFVENTVVGNMSVGYNAFGWGARMGWMGNDFGTAQYHNLRVTQSYLGFFGHNRLRGISSTGGYHSMKLHSGGQTYTGLTPYNDSEAVSGGGWASKFNVVANNEFSSAADNNGWTMMVSPENDQSAEGIEDVIVENNRYVRHSTTAQTDLLITGRRGTYRGNARTDGGAMAYSFDQHGAALPTAWKGPYFAQ